MNSIVIVAPLLLASAGSTDRGIEEAREALSPWGRYDWYDSATDDVRAVNIRSESNLDLGWLGNLLGWLFLWDWLSILSWLAIALGLVFLVYMLTKFYLSRETRGAGEADGAAVDELDESARFEALPPQVRARTRDLLGEARRAYEQGNYGEAIIYLFSHQLVALDRGQLIRLAKGKTNRQYLRELRRHAALGGLLEQTMVSFEDVFFGKHPLGRERFESCWSRLGEFDALVQQGTA